MAHTRKEMAAQTRVILWMLTYKDNAIFQIYNQFSNLILSHTEGTAKGSHRELSSEKEEPGGQIVDK